MVPKPDPIALTPEEQDLFDRIDFELSGEYESRMASLAAGADLAESLLRRGAVPEVRRRYLTDPELSTSAAGESPVSMDSHGTGSTAGKSWSTLTSWPFTCDTLSSGPIFPRRASSGSGRFSSTTLARAA